MELRPSSPHVTLLHINISNFHMKFHCNLPGLVKFSIICASYHNCNCELHKDNAVVPLAVLPEVDSKSWTIFRVWWKSAIAQVDIMFEATRFHCSTQKAALLSDAPGLIEIVATLEMFSAISCKLAVVGSTVMISTCNEQSFESCRKAEIRPISYSPFWMYIWVHRGGESSKRVAQPVETMRSSRGPDRCPPIANDIHRIQSS
jgi:hypothetical protein